MNETQTVSVDTAPLQLSHFLPYRLSVLSNTISQAIAALYEAEFDLSVWHWRVMAVLGERPGLTAREVTERTAMDKVAVSRAVSALETKGHLERCEDDRDGRALRLFLTDQGKRTYGQVMPRVMAYETELLSSLSERDRRALERVLGALAAATSPEKPLW
ncbi:MAG: MarR family winged helix-turn-helix transcriptional regulator [Pseudomonadota bacterium]